MVLCLPSVSSPTVVQHDGSSCSRRKRLYFDKFLHPLIEILRNLGVVLQNYDGLFSKYIYILGLWSLIARMLRSLAPLKVPISLRKSGCVHNNQKIKTQSSNHLIAMDQGLWSLIACMLRSLATSKSPHLFEEIRPPCRSSKYYWCMIRGAENIRIIMVEIETAKGAHQWSVSISGGSSQGLG
ncbi:hypothetical protein M9H77_26087 [Catharanthus roseus]|uniref:Uncharacterized protein n=1 Tax=Catharanthus roseus TaxID=4058 RepID=A0ACC0A8Z5_CATRO|nr:hypothetical protein M9H77_26087 [Catharanthus roseus]